MREDNKDWYIKFFVKGLNYFLEFSCMFYICIYDKLGKDKLGDKKVKMLWI